MTHDEIFNLTTKTIDICYYNAVRHYWLEFNVPTFDLMLSKKQVGAEAYLQNNHISFNYNMFCKDVHTFTKIVIPHEVSHLITYTLLGDKYHSKIFHGKVWKSVMRDCFKVNNPSALF